jgi:hypothetical protein
MAEITHTSPGVVVVGVELLMESRLIVLAHNSRDEEIDRDEVRSDVDFVVRSEQAEFQLRTPRKAEITSRIASRVSRSTDQPKPITQSLGQPRKPEIQSACDAVWRRLEIFGGRLLALRRTFLIRRAEKGYYVRRILIFGPHLLGCIYYYTFTQR